jgi:DNA end-binding protein Ku
MARPYWSGQIQISLVSFGVQLFVATETKSQISFHQINRSTGERVRHQKVVQSAIESYGESPAVEAPTGPVVRSEIVKGVRAPQGRIHPD